MMSGSGLPYGPSDQYQHSGSYGQPDYATHMSSSNVPYPPSTCPSSYPPVQPYPTFGPPPYPGNGPPGYPNESKPYDSNMQMNNMLGQPCPPNQTPYPPGAPGYFQYPGGGVLMPQQRALSPMNPYQQTADEHQQRILTSADGLDAWAGNSFSDKKLRQMFIRKVYLILMAQLLVTAVFIAVFLFCSPVRNWVHQNMWFYFCSYAVFFITYFVLVCCDSVRRRWPGNIIALSIFTLAMSYMAATISSMYESGTVLIAVGITAGVCLAISIFAIQTKIDFTLCSGLICVLSMVLILLGLACMIAFAVAGPNYIMSCIYAGVAAAIFSVFLIFDTQMVVGGKHRRYQLSPEEYIYGALQLYVDIVNLFILLLELVGPRD